MVNFDPQSTYMATIAAFTPGATPQDVFTISGNATTNVYVLKMGISTTQTAAGSNAWFIAKRSTANTGGTHAAPVAVPFNSNGPAASATLLKYTANPTAGTLVGNYWSAWVNSPTIIDDADGSQATVEVDFLTIMSQPIALLSAAETLAWNFAGAALPGGLSVLAWVLWAEASKT